MTEVNNKFKKAIFSFKYQFKKFIQEKFFLVIRQLGKYDDSLEVEYSEKCFKI